MPSLPFIGRINTEDWDWEKIGQALMEYGGIPLAVFMTVGLVLRFLRGHGVYHEFVDPMQNLPLYYVINFWAVIGVYVFRSRYQQHLQFEQKKEVAVAALSAFTWIFAQPLLLIAGYGTYIVAVMRKDQLSGTLFGRLLPDLDAVPDANEDEPEEHSDSWGHLQDVKENMS